MLVTISFGILFSFVCGLLFVPALFVVTVGAFHFYWNYVRPPLRPLRGGSRHTSWGVALPKLTPFTDGTSKVLTLEELAAKETIVKIGYLRVTGADELAGMDGQLPAAADSTKGDAGAEGGFPDGTQGDGNRDRGASPAPSSLFDKVGLSSATVSKTLQAHLHTHSDHSAATSAASSISSFVSSKIDQMQSYIGNRTKFGLNSVSGGGYASAGNRNPAVSGGSAVGGGGGSVPGFLGGAAATLDKGRERSRLLSKGFLYALLRKDTLFLYDSEAQRECKGVIVLTRYMVNLYPTGQADSEVYRKDTPIRLVQRRSQRTQRRLRHSRARHDVRMVNPTLASQRRLGNSAPNSPALPPTSPATEAKGCSDSVDTAGSESPEIEHIREKGPVHATHQVNVTHSVSLFAPEQEYCLYASNPSEKEDWYFALFHASKVRPPAKTGGGRSRNSREVEGGGGGGGQNGHGNSEERQQRLRHRQSAGTSVLRSPSPSAQQPRLYSSSSMPNLASHAGGNGETSRVSSGPQPSPGAQYHFDRAAMLKLISSVYSDESNSLEYQWLNAFAGRVFLAIYKTPMIKDSVEAKIMKKVAKMSVKKPSFLGDIKLRELDLGDAIPIISHGKLLELGPLGDMVAEVNVDYAGGFRVDMETEAIISVSSRLKPVRFPMILAVVLKSLSGRLRILMKPPPTNRFWLGFTEMPKMDLVIEPILADKAIKFSLVLQAIERRIYEILMETMVLPNMDDFPIYPSGGTGGIFCGEPNADLFAEDDARELESEYEEDIEEAEEEEDQLAFGSSVVSSFSSTVAERDGSEMDGGGGRWLSTSSALQLDMGSSSLLSPRSHQDFADSWPTSPPGGSTFDLKKNR